ILDPALISGYCAGGLRALFHSADDSQRASFLKSLLDLPNDATVVDSEVTAADNCREPLTVRAKYEIRNAFRMIDGELTGTIHAGWERYGFAVSQNEPRRAPVRFPFDIAMESEWLVKGPANLTSHLTQTLDRDHQDDVVSWKVNASPTRNETRI